MQNYGFCERCLWEVVLSVSCISVSTVCREKIVEFCSVNWRPFLCVRVCVLMCSAEGFAASSIASSHLILDSICQHTSSCSAPFGHRSGHCRWLLWSVSSRRRHETNENRSQFWSAFRLVRVSAVIHSSCSRCSNPIGSAVTFCSVLGMVWWTLQVQCLVLPSCCCIRFNAVRVCFLAIVLNCSSVVPK